MRARFTLFLLPAALAACGDDATSTASTSSASGAAASTSSGSGTAGTGSGTGSISTGTGAGGGPGAGGASDGGGPDSGGGGGGGAGGEGGTGGEGGGEPRALGEACAAGQECGSGFCVDDVCCESACDATCLACSGDLTGAADGTCAPAAVGSDPHDQCDEGLCRDGTCDGRGACGALPDETPCREAAGPCDAPEVCIGGACPADLKTDAGVLCRSSAGACDLEEACDGVLDACPSDALDTTSVCRPATGDCDVEEICDGRGAACPADAFAPATTECGAYLCQGASNLCETGCTVHADCAASAFCSTAGACLIAKIAFTTSTTTNGNIGGLAGADALCVARAQAAGLPGTYRAWLSDAQTSAASRLTHATIPYAFVNGTPLADSWDDLVDGTIDSPFRITEFGVQVPGNLPFTSTSESGASLGPEFCGDWTSTTGSVWTGQSDQIGSAWTFAQLNSGNCNIQHRLYCLQQ